MNLATLQLEQTFLTRLEIKPSGTPPPGKSTSVNIQAKTSIASIEEPGRWRVDLDIEVRGEEGQPSPPYSVSISVSGLVRITSEMEPKTARRLAFVNGLSMLYSAARETVLLLTGRFPAGPYVLPSLTFADEYDRLAPLDVGEPGPGQ